MLVLAKDYVSRPFSTEKGFVRALGTKGKEVAGGPALNVNRVGGV